MQKKTDITDIDIAESGKKLFFISVFIPIGYKLSLKNIDYSRWGIMVVLKWVFFVIFVISAHFLLIIICFVLIFLLYLQSKTTLLSISHFKK